MENHSTQKTFPPLDFNKTRPREFNYYTEEQRAAVIYSWLKTGMSTRDMDVVFLKMPSDKSSNGYQSFGIYRYLGLTGKHQGFFREWAIDEIISYFQPLCMNPDYCVVFYYFLEHAKKIGRESMIEKIPAVKEIRRNYPESSIKEQNWIRNSLVAEEWLDDEINMKLLKLKDVSGIGKVYLKDKEVYYSNTTVKETLKSLYDFRCQICGDVVLRTGWTTTLSRKNSWSYMSADIHHILPLSKGGPDMKSNMLCLCPTCHRKFHSGEYRLHTRMGRITCCDELLGKELDITKKHSIVLS